MAEKPQTLCRKLKCIVWINCLLENSFITYPTKEIEDGWKHILYQDHGFGGGNGHITDKVFGNAMKKGYEISNALRSRALENITKYINVKETEGISVVVFNPTNHTLTDTVQYKLDIRKIPARYFIVEDELGNKVDYQIIDEDNAFELTIEFVAENVNQMGV